jgi:GNAT superfamily N-acetyltransferase
VCFGRGTGAVRSVVCEALPVDVRPIPGLGHLPFAEVWFHAVDEESFDQASAAARALGKPGLEAWTTTATPDVARFLESRGFEEVRRYAISELDVSAAPDPGPPAVPLVSFADRPDLAAELYALAQTSYADQPGRAGSTIDEAWFDWALRPSDPEGSFIALEDGRVAAYGSVEKKEEDGLWWHGFLAVARPHRGRGLAGAIKRAQVAWAKTNGIPQLRTATETRLEGMRALNERLGYALLYEEIVLRGDAAARRA